VEKPYDLAKFMLEDKNEKLLEKIHYSMTADLSPLLNKPKSKKVKKTITVEEDGETVDKEVVVYEKEEVDELKKDTIQRNKLIYTLNVNPEIPLFIVYFTIYPDPKTGKLVEYRDVYDYDKVIWEHLQSYQ